MTTRRAVHRAATDVRRARARETAQQKPPVVIPPTQAFDTLEWERQHREAERQTIHDRPLTDDAVDG